MNYIKQIRLYWKTHKKCSLGAGELAVYFYLLELSNRADWQNPIIESNISIQQMLKIRKFNSLCDYRNRLQMAGLIKFSHKRGNSNVEYDIWDVETEAFAKPENNKNNLRDDVRDDLGDDVGDELRDELSNPLLGINNKLKQKPKLSLTQAGAGQDLDFENHYSHADVLKATVNDELFLEQAAMAIRNAGISTFPNVFKEYCVARLAEMELTGESTRYSLGSIRRILMQDFKFNQQKNKNLQMRQIRAGEVKPYISKRRKLD